MATLVFHTILTAQIFLHLKFLQITVRIYDFENERYLCPLKSGSRGFKVVTATVEGAKKFASMFA